MRVIFFYFFFVALFITFSNSTNIVPIPAKVPVGKKIAETPWEGFSKKPLQRFNYKDLWSRIVLHVALYILISSNGVVHLDWLSGARYCMSRPVRGAHHTHISYHDTTSFWQFKYWTSLVFRSPLCLKSIETICMIQTQ